MAAIKNYFLPAICILLIMASCKDKDDNNNPTVLENKRRAECERRSSVCGGNDGMRFYQSTPVIQVNPGGGGTVTETWTSFVICCDVFPRLMDSLTVFNHLLDSALRQGRPFDKSDTISTIIIRVGFEYYDDLNGKRWEWLSFGDSTFRWLMPRGEYFEEHKRELEEAHARCCVL